MRNGMKEEGKMKENEDSNRRLLHRRVLYGKSGEQVVVVTFGREG